MMKGVVALIVAAGMIVAVGCSRAKEDVQQIKVGHQVSEARQSLKSYADERVTGIDQAVQSSGKELQKNP